MRYFLFVITLLLFFSSCQEEEVDTTLFELKENKAIGINFENNLSYSREFNVYKYRNFYNGGGVALGDVNKDGLVDVYMVSNQDSNRLFINKGNWKFEDVTKSAGIAGGRAWSTGVSMVDINNDGLLDIYVCNSGDVQGDNKENELFINNGDLTFTESAAKYNLNDKGFSTHASFFDYDKDGDLDVYLLNNSFQAIGSFNLRKNIRPERDELGGDKLMRNDDGVYVDVSEAAGIYGSVIGFGLGITIGDVNNDNWEDIFISNDFFERDYLYINQKDGTFKEDLEAQIPSISGASMGADIADINNDGFNEIFVTEMLPSEYERLKSVTTFENWDKYQYNVQNGYHHQFTRNFLHLNNGDNSFSDVSRLAGVEASDWSWGALFFDMDNDGLKDLFIANGIYKDLTDQDYLQYVSSETVMKSIINDDGVNYKELIDIIPSNKVKNHAYQNHGDVNFSDFTNSGLQTKGFSNGSAYGDLDNDGDLDLVVNNINMPSFIYENKANEKSKNNYLKFVLEGTGKNKLAIGAKIIVSSGEKEWSFENQPIRGFQSSMDNRPNIGVGEATEVDVIVIWPSGKSTSMKNVKVNQILTLAESNATNEIVSSGLNKSAIKFTPFNSSIDFNHQENRFVDFNRDPLNYHMMSTQGPCVEYTDVNGDGKKDVIIPGPKGFETSILLNQDDKFISQTSANFVLAKEAEQVKCELFDADNDGDLDLYLASGGVEMTKFSALLNDQLLLNNGKGEFTKSSTELPFSDKISTGAIAHGDIDQDGDVDLFVGERTKIGAYGSPCSGFLFSNDGKGNFVDITATWCPELSDIGMITDAKFIDLNEDNLLDLVVIGEFMEVNIFKNENGKFAKIDLGLESKGWWNTMEAVDVDGDGDLDFVLGNHGLNSRFKANPKHPVRMYFYDFDNNGSGEGIMTQNREDGKDYPFALRHNLAKRMPMLNKKFPDFKSFKNASMLEIFSEELLQKANVSEVNELESILLINNGDFSFEKKKLPKSVQISPMYAIAPVDVNMDGFVGFDYGREPLRSTAGNGKI